MADGEISAVFKALARQMAEAMERAAGKMAAVSEETAERAAAGGKSLEETDAAVAKRFDDIRTEETGGERIAAETTGPPWPVSDGVTGPARGKDLRPPNNRHTVAGARSGQVRGDNTVILRGNEQAVRDDVREIAAGNAEWDDAAAVYRVNERSYRVEPQGTVFPVSGPGLVYLDRNEYAALKEIAKARGDPAQVPAFTQNPRFTSNPDAITKAKAIYDGTYLG
ncbi:hypothetical protein GCM10010435_40550 [Winogradskya consettensis]|uniref:Uncharacterized protein n=1 Tax=Winogradskya consettensis TaxID=113560 RepID=A0A919VKN8_9ACTN|nr:hypothetical protein [Actinoplanes consettensis]GIM69729.1 hypothetical protein Aco04nite_16680 [Actinoplanes consettensis]